MVITVHLYSHWPYWMLWSGQYICVHLNFIPSSLGSMLPHAVHSSSLKQKKRFLDNVGEYLCLLGQARQKQSIWAEIKRENNSRISFFRVILSDITNVISHVSLCYWEARELIFEAMHNSHLRITYPVVRVLHLQEAFSVRLLKRLYDILTLPWRTITDVKLYDMANSAEGWGYGIRDLSDIWRSYVELNVL